MKVEFVEMYMDDQIKEIASDVLETGRYVKGSNVKKLEDNFSDFCGAEYALTFNSGTSALFASYYAADISYGDEVIVPSFSFFATVSPLLFLKAKPIFAEIDEETYTLDPEDVKEKISKKTEAIVPVHLYGHPTDMNPIIDLTQDYNLSLIEDACQAHGGTYRGEKIGSFGNISCFSFYPSKNITVCGDGGIVVTNDKELAEKCRKFRDHGRGKNDKYVHESLGLNLRMSEILGAIGDYQLKKLEEWNWKRRLNTKLYLKYLNEYIVTPIEREWAQHVYHLFVIRSEKRDKLKNYLSDNNIGTGIHYPIPIHKQTVLKDSNFPKLSISEKAADEVLSLPMYPDLSEEEIKYVSEKVNKFEARNR